MAFYSLGILFMAEIVRQHFAYSGAERILHCRSLQINRSFET